MKFDGRRTRSAFTLIECLFSLMLFGLSLQVLLLTVQSLKHATQVTNRSQDNINWHVGTIELTNFTRQATYKSHEKQKLIFFDAKQAKTYRLKYRAEKQEFYMLGSEGGYMPLIGNLDKVNLTQQRLAARFNGRAEYQYYFKFRQGSKKDD